MSPQAKILYEFLCKKDAHKVLQIPVNTKLSLKQRMVKGFEPMPSTLRKYFKLMGVPWEHTETYTASELRDVVKFCIDTNQATRSLGADFLIEQWKLRRAKS